MVLRLYNTLTKTKEEFRPLDPANVCMYVCGPTVYDYAHIGNARPAIVFDVLFRLLRHLYGADHVTYVRNITDVDDKIIARANESGRFIGDITAETEKQYHDDVAALGCLPPTFEPRATENIPAMIAMIQALIDTKHAYAAKGHVLYDVASKNDYGKLARRSLNEMIAGARVEVAPYKKNPMDFVLWKPSKPGEPLWNSPWGKGRPGWHIECSAMSEALLGETFDIHGGGIDLMFPHHENEIAQSEGAHHGHKLANIWMHNGFLQVEGEKMSKSLGNFVTIHELLHESSFGSRKWLGGVVRLAMLMTNYAQPIDWTVNRLEEADIRLGQWLGPVTSRGVPEKGQLSEQFIEALENDLNTHMALSVLDEMSAQARSPRTENPADVANNLAATLLWLGIASYEDFAEARADYDDLRVTIRAAMAGVDKEYVVSSIATRNAAREAKNFIEADRIRDELLAKGIVLKDNADGTTAWEVKR